MAPFPIDRQLILNRLGETSLNRDAVELIKEFTFESVVNWCIRVEAERMKRLTNAEFKNMNRWRTTDDIQWVVNFDAYANKSNVSYIKEIGASNCPSCGNYIDHHLMNSVWGGEWVPSQVAQVCAPRAICECPGNWHDDTITQVDEEEEDWDF